MQSLPFNGFDECMHRTPLNLMIKLLTAKMKPHLQLKDLFLNDNSCDIFRQVHADTYV